MVIILFAIDNSTCHGMMNIATKLQNGDTALHIAAAMGRRKLVRILLESGYTTDRDGNGSQNAATNIELLNLQHERAIDIAQRKENKEIVEMLKNPSKIIANPNTTSSGIGVENNEDGITLDFDKIDPLNEKSPDKRKKKKYQKANNIDRKVCNINILYIIVNYDFS